MPFRAYPEQLSVLQQVFDDHCRETGLPLVDPRREELAHDVMSLFEKGAQTIETLKAELSHKSQTR